MLIVVVIISIINARKFDYDVAERPSVRPYFLSG